MSLLAVLPCSGHCCAWWDWLVLPPSSTDALGPCPDRQRRLQPVMLPLSLCLLLPRDAGFWPWPLLSYPAGGSLRETLFSHASTLHQALQCSGAVRPSISHTCLSPKACSAAWSSPLWPDPSFLPFQVSSLLCRTPGPAEAPRRPRGQDDPGPNQKPRDAVCNRLAFLLALSPGQGAHGLPEPSPGQGGQAPTEKGGLAALRPPQVLPSAHIKAHSGARQKGRPSPGLCLHPGDQFRVSQREPPDL